MSMAYGLYLLGQLLMFFKIFKGNMWVANIGVKCNETTTNVLRARNKINH
jgi:hypothetical protein